MQSKAHDDFEPYVDGGTPPNFIAAVFPDGGLARFIAHDERSNPDMTCTKLLLFYSPYTYVFLKAAVPSGGTSIGRSH